jgi:hypothetical protein
MEYFLVPHPTVTELADTVGGFKRKKKKENLSSKPKLTPPLKLTKRKEKKVDTLH